jgi:ABC-type sugar transport system permease subunit
MPHRTFLAFMFPSMAAMIVFIALPIVSVMFQSLHIEHARVLVETETCDPFGGCSTQTRVDAAATKALEDAQPAGRFNGLRTYVNAAHLALDDVTEIWRTAPDLRTVFSQITNLPFYKALLFTLAYTFIVTPLSLWLGFLIAMAVNAVPQALRGSITYLTLSLIALSGDPDLSLKASAALSWTVLFVHGAWNSAPFVFIVFYAALQTVPRDTLESAVIDGASRWQRQRYVVLPHLKPIAIFLTLVLIMDNFRVFESIVAFSAGAQASSLSVLIFKDLHNASSPLYGSAAATSILTIACIALLMMPSMIRSWHSFQAKA